MIYSKCISSPDKFPLCVYVGWMQDYADAYTFGPPLFDSSSLYPACCNYSLLGASAKQLTDWGYPAGTDGPDPWTTSWRNAPRSRSVTRAYTCWADLDKFLMEDVVPWVPKTFTNENDITSARVVNYSFDYSGGRRRSTASRSRTAARSARPDQERCGGGRATAPRSASGSVRLVVGPARFSRRSSTCCAPAARSRRG